LPASTGYVRSSFFAARGFSDLDDLNAQADDWCRGLAADRRCPGEPDRTVRAVFADEVPRLLPLPDNPAPLLERAAVKLGKQRTQGPRSSPLSRETRLSHPHLCCRATLAADCARFLTAADKSDFHRALHVESNLTDPFNIASNVGAHQWQDRQGLPGWRWWCGQCLGFLPLRPVRKNPAHQGLSLTTATTR
jgi:hypothetical protein